ncbi:conjugal transfer protein TraF [Helicobacter sp. T3_23-1059]
MNTFFSLKALFGNLLGVRNLLAYAFVCGVVSTQAFGLEFGTMGNVSAGMGGAGVAVKNSPFALYYNPALLSAETKRVRFGYSLGLEVREKNLDKIVDINLAGLNSSNLTSTTGADFKSIQHNLETLKSALSQNAFNLISQNGVTFQFAPALLRGSIGTFGVGYFASFYGGSSIKADTNRMELILKYSNGGQEAYCKVDFNGGCTPSDKATYDSSSLQNSLEQGDAHSIVAQGFLLNEIPIGYAYTFYTKYVNINLGVSGRLISASLNKQTTFLSSTTNLGNEAKNFANKGNFETKANFAIDAGAMLEIDLPDFRYLTFGFVAKNINSPKFTYSNGGEVQIKPQFRLGAAYNQKNLVLAIDADLNQNEIISHSNQKPFSQMVGGGIKIDLRAFDIRAGLMKDIRQDDGIIITTGVNILGFLDVALQCGTELAQTQRWGSFPRYLSLKVGGNFSF